MNTNTGCFDSNNNYSRFVLNLDLADLKELEQLKPYKTYLALFFLYLSTILLIYVSIMLTKHNYLFYFPCIFLIAGRQGAFIQMTHEASHFLVTKKTKLNDFIGNYFCAFPIGVNFSGFRSGHNNHHVNTATAEDSPTDLDKYRVTNVKKFEIYKLFLKDIIGISALQVFLSYGQDKKNINKVSQSKLDFFKTLAKMSFVQLLILSFFQFNILSYILFWLIPLISPHMFLMRIRGLAEHGQANQLGCAVESNSSGTYYTRSFLTKNNKYKFLPLVFLEKILIGSLKVHYHHEHHLFPKVPWYNLEKLNKKIYKNVIENNYAGVYRKGYFSAAFL